MVDKQILKEIWDRESASCVYCYESDIIYPDIPTASHDLEVSEEDILECCRFNKISNGGYHFCFAKNSDELIKELDTLNDGIYKRTPVCATYFVTQEQIHFPSIKIASRMLGVSEYDIRRSLEDPYHDVENWLFERWNEDEVDVF